MYWDDGVWRYEIDNGFGCEVREVPGLGPTVARDVVLMTVAVAENARRAELIGPALNVVASVTRQI